MKTIKEILTICLIVCLSFMLVSCGKTNDADINGEAHKIELPTFLYDKSAQVIAFTNDGYLYSYSSENHIGTYNYEFNIFVGRDGKYLGEITREYFLLYNNQSTYKIRNFGILAIAPIPRNVGIAPIKSTRLFSSSWVDIIY